jgi:hypothetical protein
MDFKIGDDFDENGNSNEHKMSKKTAIIIVTVVAIVFGLLVFFISNAIFGKRDDDKPAVDTQVKLTNENVQILYKYVAYKNNGYDNDLFVRENSVTSSTFTDQDKLYYALQFVEPEELLYSGEKNDKKQKIYIISVSRIRDHLQRFFGEDISFSPVDEITYKFSFTINDLGVATLTYSEEEQAYKVVFNKEKELTEEEQEKALVKKVYTELSSATKKPDGTLILNEKVIYTDLGKENNTFRIDIYKDYKHSTKIETKQNITKEDLTANPFSITDYLDKAATISYTFKVNQLNNSYYFDNSTITY